MQAPTTTLRAIADELQLFVDPSLAAVIARAHWLGEVANRSGSVQTLRNTTSPDGPPPPIEPLQLLTAALWQLPELREPWLGRCLAELGLSPVGAELPAPAPVDDVAIAPQVAHALRSFARSDGDRVLDVYSLALAIATTEEPRVGRALGGASSELAGRLATSREAQLRSENGRPLAPWQLELDRTLLGACGRRLEGGGADALAAALAPGEVLFVDDGTVGHRVVSARALYRLAREGSLAYAVPRLVADASFSPSSYEALGLADAIARAAGKDRVHAEHLLVALFDVKDGPTRSAFTRANISREQLLRRLREADFAAPDVGEHGSADRIPALSAHAAQAVGRAGARAFATKDTLIRTRDLLAGIFDVADCRVVQLFPEVPPLLAGIVDVRPGAQKQAKRTAYAPGFGGDGLDGPDVLNFTPEVDALARLAASDSIDPPLSIGLFGEWGSGKSYFMRRLRERIAGFADAARRQRDRPDVVPPPYCAEIVQVEFNAWNYVEVDLWASLVAHIFDRLQAHVTGADKAEQKRWENLLHRLDDAETRRHDAQRALELAQARLDERRREQEARERTLQRQLELLRGHSTIGALIRDVEGALGFDVAREVWDSIVLRRKRASEIVAAASPSLRAARALFSGPARWWLIGALVLVAAGALLVWNLEKDGVAPEIATVSAAGLLLAKWMKTAIEKSDRVMDVIEKLQQGLQELEERQKASDAASVEELRECAAAVEQARAEYKAELARVEELRREVARLYPGEQLGQFLADRAGSEDYRKHLGLPALVRRDFDRLGRLVRPSTHRLTAADLAGIAPAYAPPLLLDLFDAITIADRLQREANAAETACTEPTKDKAVRTAREAARERARERAEGAHGRCRRLCEKACLEEDPKYDPERSPIESIRFELARVELGEHGPRVVAVDGRVASFEEVDAKLRIDLRTSEREPIGPRDKDGNPEIVVSRWLLKQLRPACVPARLEELLRTDAPVRGPRITQTTAGWMLRDHENARCTELTISGDSVSVETSWPGHPSIERIVLYIDDLDRCPPSRVVDVLGAVHLLLAFPLFVVVVAVDERWLLGSLAHQHAKQIRSEGEAKAPREPQPLDLGRARDYLEKIFQIPYWVPRMSTRAAQELIATLSVSSDELATLPALAAAPAKPPAPAVVPPTPIAASPSPDSSTALAQPPPSSSTAIAAIDRPQPAAASPATPPAPDTSAQDEELLRVQPIVIGEHERAALQALVSVVHRSPRAVKRFVNTYRVVRTIVGDDGDDLLCGPGKAAFGVVTLMVAMMVGDPERGGTLVDAIALADEDQPVRDAIAAWRSSAKLGKDEPITEVLATAIAATGWGRTRCGDVAVHVARVRRFSFGGGGRPTTTG